MFLSFLIPSAFEGRPARHLVVFYKQLHAMGRDQALFVGEDAYFEDPRVLRASGRPEWDESWRSTFEYEPPETLDGVERRILPADLFAARLRRLNSPWRLYGQMVTRRLPEFEAKCEVALASASRGRDLEAVVTFANLPSLWRAAERRRVPVVHTHFGPLRAPAWVMTGYWDRRGVNSRTDVVRRFARFRRELASRRRPLLTREELLHTFRCSPLPAPAPPTEARYRIGVALQGDENTYVHGLGGLDVLTTLRRGMRRDDLLVRSHPGALTKYSDELGVPDTSPSSAEFVLQCRTVVTVNSGIALEAMLLGRDAVVLGDSPFRIAARRTVASGRTRRERDLLLALNFLAFGYMVPYALMFDPDYLRWRLSDPPELEIVRHHQHWYASRRRALLPGQDARRAMSTGMKLVDADRLGKGPLFVFGAGVLATEVVGRLGERLAVQGVFDNDPTKWMVQIHGKRITAPFYEDDATVVLASLTHADSITSQLRQLGYPPERIIRLA